MKCDIHCRRQAKHTPTLTGVYRYNSLKRLFPHKTNMESDVKKRKEDSLKTGDESSKQMPKISTPSPSPENKKYLPQKIKNHLVNKDEYFLRKNAGTDNLFIQYENKPLRRQSKSFSKIHFGERRTQPYIIHFYSKWGGPSLNMTNDWENSYNIHSNILRWVLK